ncbi:MAG: hypothetical protein A2138_11945 [Deltaproteobacteria bacterium RBG_16_71_12]|nr:MAG: hypothetical protein A2138_11945 [Deltaproteobacteria bacterium RBG_16_71_12]
MPVTPAALALVATLALPAAGGRECATMAMREAAWRGFPAMASALTERPWAEEIASFSDSASAPVRVHLGVGVDAARGALAMSALEAAWAMQVSVAGFDVPLSDAVDGVTDGGDGRLDVYLVPLPPGTGALTVALADAADDDGKRASPAFMKADPTLAAELLEVYLHHEFQHVLQFALDTRESLMWSESTAVYWEVRARPDVDEWQQALADFQRHPQAPIFTDGAAFAPFSEADSPRLEYGAVLFALYLDEVHGDGAGTLLADLWRGSVQPDAVPDDEPDWLDAADVLGFAAGTLVPDFVGWRALVGPLAVTDDGPAEALGGGALLGAESVAASTLDGQLQTTGEDSGPFQLSCLVRQVEVPGNVDVLPVHVHAEATLADQTLAVATLITVPGSGTATRALAGTGATIDADLQAPSGALVQVALCDITAADADEAPAARPIRFSLLRTDVEWPDAGPAVEDAGVIDVDAGPPPPPDPICTCQSSGGATNLRKGLYVLGLLASVVMLVVRGGRARRRRRLYQDGDADPGIRR